MISNSLQIGFEHQISSKQVPQERCIGYAIRKLRDGVHSSRRQPAGEDEAKGSQKKKNREMFLERIEMKREFGNLYKSFSGELWHSWRTLPDVAC